MSSIHKIIASGLILTSILASCSNSEKSKANESPINVSTYSPRVQSDNAVFVSGVVSSKQTAQISTRMMGFINKIYVKQGDKVQKGQLLVSINSDDVKAKQAQVQAMIHEAEAAALNANKDYERYQNLYAQKSISDKELENMQLRKVSIDAKLQMARQSLKEVNSMFSYTNLRAPFSGTVTQKMMDEGSTASPGMPILTIEQAGELEIKASVPENYIPHIAVGTPVKIDIKSLGSQLTGSISELSTSAEATGGQYSMRVAISQEAKSLLRAGMYAGIQIPISGVANTSKGVWIEESYVIRRDQLTGVYIATEDNKAMLRWIRLGKKENGSVEVLSGLSATDRIINPSGAKLYNGRRIKITK